jgi:hypothetical protein
MKRLLSLTVLLLLMAATQQNSARAAAVAFSVTATANANLYGYESGASYTFGFITSESFLNNASSEFSAESNEWDEEFDTDDSLWGGSFGSGFVGSYVRDISANNTPDSYIETWDDGALDDLYFRGGTDAVKNIGLFTPGGQGIRNISFVFPSLTSFSFPGNWSQPNTYFAAYLGSYAATGGSISLTPAGQAALSFTTTNLTISSVPEPGTGAWLLLAGGAALSAVRRRRSF